LRQSFNCFFINILYNYTIKIDKDVEYLHQKCLVLKYTINVYLSDHMCPIPSQR
jgi:hypothetical protein